MGKYQKAQFHVCVPGMPSREELKRNPSIKRILGVLDGHGYKDWPMEQRSDGSLIEMADKEYTFCMDSVPGSFRLDQDWLTFNSPAESDYGWVKPEIFTEKEWEDFFELVQYGYIIVMVFHEKDGDFVPHT